MPDHHRPLLPLEAPPSSGGSREHSPMHLRRWQMTALWAATGFGIVMLLFISGAVVGSGAAGCTSPFGQHVGPCAAGPGPLQPAMGADPSTPDRQAGLAAMQAATGIQVPMVGSPASSISDINEDLMYAGSSSFTPEEGVAAARHLAEATLAPAVASSTHQGPQHAQHRIISWRGLPDFLQHCEHLESADGVAHQLQQQQLLGTAEGGAATSMGQLLGFDDAGAATGAPRSTHRILEALHNLTDISLPCAPRPRWHPCGADEMPLGGTCIASASAGGTRVSRGAGSSGSSSSPRIGILLISSPRAGSYAPLSEANKRYYANKHGYSLHIMAPEDTTRHPAWAKVPAALSLLPHYDWLWLVDLDTLVMNSDVRLEQWIDEQYDVVVSRDCNGVNTGSMLVRGRSQWSEALLAEMYARPYAKPTGHWEQAAFRQISELAGVRQRIKALPTNKGLNSYGSTAALCSGGYEPGDFLVHFPGVDDKHAAMLHYWQRLSAEERQAQAQVESSVGSLLGMDRGGRAEQRLAGNEAEAAENAKAAHAAVLQYLQELQQLHADQALQSVEEPASVTRLFGSAEQRPTPEVAGGEAAAAATEDALAALAANVQLMMLNL